MSDAPLPEVPVEGAALKPRQELILRTVVEEHIASGTPRA